ncbi:MAG TPA: type I 3-dehydroquinate dehydratase [Firmicutes bacterium]|nr:type I 3-dehydroquinate dehydratase [Bacillota bacterium]
MRVLQIRGCAIGSGRPKICVPLTAGTLPVLLAEAREVADHKPDLAEWRADYLHDMHDPQQARAALRQLRAALGELPLIFTCRDRREGGVREMAPEARVRLLQAAATGGADLVDIELQSGINNIRAVTSLAREHGVYVIVSFHDFAATPPVAEMVRILCRQQDLGADIVKLAVMPRTPRDVLHLLEATLLFRENYAQVPVITMAMSGLGLISRLAGAAFGSDLTFASYRRQTAPGQIPLELLRAIQHLA